MIKIKYFFCRIFVFFGCNHLNKNLNKIIIFLSRYFCLCQNDKNNFLFCFRWPKKASQPRKLRTNIFFILCFKYFSYKMFKVKFFKKKHKAFLLFFIFIYKISQFTKKAFSLLYIFMFSIIFYKREINDCYKPFFKIVLSNKRS